MGVCRLWLVDLGFDLIWLAHILTLEDFFSVNSKKATGEKKDSKSRDGIV